MTAFAVSLDQNDPEMMAIVAPGSLLAEKIATRIRHLLVEHEIILPKYRDDETAVQLDWIAPLLRQGYDGIKFDGHQSGNNACLTAKAHDLKHLEEHVPQMRAALADFLSPILPGRTLIFWLWDLPAAKYAEGTIPNVPRDSASPVCV